MQEGCADAVVITCGSIWSTCSCGQIAMRGPRLLCVLVWPLLGSTKFSSHNKKGCHCARTCGLKCGVPPRAFSLECCTAAK